MKSLVLTALVFMAGIFSGVAIGSVNFSGLCVAGICLDDKGINLEKVRDQFGKGFEVRRRDDAGSRSYCYYDASNKVWGEFTFGGDDQHSRRPTLQGITLTTTAICPKDSSTSVPLESAGGVRIGQSETELVQIMGKPDRVDDAVQREKKNPAIKRTRYSARFGEQVFVYERKGDLGFVFVFLHAGRVSTVWQSMAE